MEFTMEIKDILEKLSDNSEMVQFVTNLNEKAQNADGLKSKINDLELKSNEAIEGRQKLKDLLRNTLGIDEVSEENLLALKDTKGKGDDKLIAEIDNLKGLLEKSNGEKEQLVSDYENKFSDMLLTNSIRDLGIGSMASTPVMEKQILALLKEGATRDGDNIVYKNQDGSTKYSANNAPYTVTDRLNELKGNADYAPMFKASTASGTGTSGQDGTTHTDISKMSPTEMMKQGRK